LNNRLLTSTIIETLNRSGALKISELFKAVHKIHSDLEKTYLNKILMTMELQGLIRVYNLTREKRRVELVKG